MPVSASLSKWHRPFKRVSYGNSSIYHIFILPDNASVEKVKQTIRLVISKVKGDMSLTKVLRMTNSIMQKRPLLYNSVIYGSFFTSAELIRQSFSNVSKVKYTFGFFFCPEMLHEYREIFCNIVHANEWIVIVYSQSPKSREIPPIPKDRYW